MHVPFQKRSDARGANSTSPRKHPRCRTMATEQEQAPTPYGRCTRSTLLFSVVWTNCAQSTTPRSHLASKVATMVSRHRPGATAGSPPRSIESTRPRIFGARDQGRRRGVMRAQYHVYPMAISTCIALRRQLAASVSSSQLPCPACAGAGMIERYVSKPPALVYAPMFDRSCSLSLRLRPC